MLRLVLRALTKIDSGQPLAFGLCEITALPIERERLELMPWAPVGAVVGQWLERQGIAIEDGLPLP